jgi:O-antigen/teichoic acid export membrane protein
MKPLQKIFRSSLLRSASVYTMGNVVNASIPFLLMPVLTRYLSPEDYGYTAMFTLLISLLSPFMGANAKTSLAVTYYKKEFDFPAYMMACLWLLLATGFIMFVSVILFHRQIGKYTLFPLEWQLFVVLACFLGYVSNVFQIIVRAKEQAKLFVSFQLSYTFFNVGLAFILVVFLHYNWQGQIMASVISYVIFASIAFFLFCRWNLIKPIFRWDYVKHATCFGIPLIPHVLSMQLITASNRFFITNACGLYELGLFAVGSQIGMAIELLVSSFNNAYSPYLYKKLSSITDTGKRKLVKQTYMYVVAIIAVALAYSLFMPSFLSVFLGERFRDASKYVFCFAIAGAAHGIYYMVVNYIIFQYKTKYLMMVTSACSILHVVVAYIAIQEYGAMGAAIAMVITNVLMAGATWWLSSRVYAMPWLNFHFVERKSH